MASVGFFGRVRNLWRGFLSIWISDVEKKHPEVAYENAINSMVEKYTQLKKATAAIIARREDIDGRLAAKQKDLAQTTADLNTALETNQQDLGMVHIQKQKALQDDVNGLQGDHEQALKDADSAKASLMQVQTEIKKLKAEKDNQLAKMASAEARVKIQEQLDGLTLDNESKAPRQRARAHQEHHRPGESQPGAGRERRRQAARGAARQDRRRDREVRLGSHAGRPRRRQGRPEDDVTTAPVPHPAQKKAAHRARQA